MRRRWSKRRSAVLSAVGAIAASASFGACTSGAGGAGEGRRTADVTPSRAPGPVTLQVGQDVTEPSGATTLLEVRRPFGAAQHAPSMDGQEWLGVRVRACAAEAEPAASEGMEVGWYRFSAAGPDGERYPGGAWEYAPWPPRQFAQRTLVAGECATGWVLMAVVEGAPVRSVRLVDPDGLPVAEWLVKQGPS